MGVLWRRSQCAFAPRTNLSGSVHNSLAHRHMKGLCVVVFVSFLSVGDYVVSGSRRVMMTNSMSSVVNRSAIANIITLVICRTSTLLNRTMSFILKCGFRTSIYDFQLR